MPDIRIGTATFIIPDRNLANWDIDTSNLFASRGKYQDKPIGKFSLHISSRELILESNDVFHKIMILNHGTHPFAEYVRGIFLPELNRVCLRRFSADEQKSVKALDAAQKFLEDAGATPYEYVLNVDNQALYEMTGRKNW